MAYRRFALVLVASSIFVMIVAPPAGAGRNTFTPVSVAVADGFDLSSDGAPYAGTLNGGTLEMRLPAGRGLTVRAGGQTLRCAPEPYWSKIWVYPNGAGQADARIDCTATASGLADGTAGTRWVIDYPPYKYAVKGDLTQPCIVVGNGTYTPGTGCFAKAYGPSGWGRSGPDYFGPVTFLLTTAP